MQQNNNLPRATKVESEKLVQLWAQYKSLDEESPEYDSVENEILTIVCNYEWDNYPFRDPMTGKVGIKDVLGNIIVPPAYDSCSFALSFIATHLHRTPCIMEINGYLGMVEANGSGRELSPFIYKWLYPLYNLLSLLSPPLFIFVKENKTTFGIMNNQGKIICPDILTSIDLSNSKLFEQIYDVCIITDGTKYGVVDMTEEVVIPPIYDMIETPVDHELIFHKNGQKGYVSFEGEFVPIELAEEDPRYEETEFMGIWPGLGDN